jgi:hypothetical protein
MRILLPLVQLNQAACFGGRRRETSAREGAYDNEKEEQIQMQRLSSNFQSPLAPYSGRCRLSQETGHVTGTSYYCSAATTSLRLAAFRPLLVGSFVDRTWE